MIDIVSNSQIVNLFSKKMIYSGSNLLLSAIDLKIERLKIHPIKGTCRKNEINVPKKSPKSPTIPKHSIINPIKLHPYKTRKNPKKKRHVAFHFLI